MRLICSPPLRSMVDFRSSQLSTRVPSTPTILSPVWRPASCAALPATMRSTVVLGPSLTRPWPAITTKNSTKAMIRLTVTPARMVARRLPGVRLAEGAGLVGGVDLFHVGHADDAHVAAGGDGLHAVLGLAPGERPEAGSEADEELGDLHARALGHPVVAELVEHHHEDDAEHEQQRRAAAGHEDDQRHHRGEERDAGCRWRRGC